MNKLGSKYLHYSGCAAKECMNLMEQVESTNGDNGSESIIGVRCTCKTHSNMEQYSPMSMVLCMWEVCNVVHLDLASRGGERSQQSAHFFIRETAAERFEVFHFAFLYYLVRLKDPTLHQKH